MLGLLDIYRTEKELNPLPHQWILGEWGRERYDRYESRKDTCARCGLTRDMIRFKDHAGKQVEMPSSYQRGMSIFADDGYVPECWGGPNP